MNEFKWYPSIARLSRDMIITEKIDGTNACIVITEDMEIFAQSRNRILSITDDNYWFAKWVDINKEELLNLGIWYHYGEWWGNGIQDGYWLSKLDKRFSLFSYVWDNLPSCISVVPVLYSGTFSTEKIDNVMDELARTGSIIAPWYMYPEWVVIYHTSLKVFFKKTFKNDEWKYLNKQDDRNKNYSRSLTK